MILNKASAERGFAHATVYKSEVGGAGGWDWSSGIVGMQVLEGKVYSLLSCAVCFSDLQLISLLDKGTDRGKPLYEFGMCGLCFVANLIELCLLLQLHTGVAPKDASRVETHLDSDGLPRLGTLLREGDPYYRWGWSPD